MPVDSVESLALGPTDPRMNSGLTDIEFVNDLVMRATASDSGDDGSSASGFPFTEFRASARGSLPTLVGEEEAIFRGFNLSSLVEKNQWPSKGLEINRIIA